MELSSYLGSQKKKTKRRMKKGEKFKLIGDEVTVGKSVHIVYSYKEKLKARFFFRLYLALKADYLGSIEYITIKEDSSAFRCFLKLVKKLNRLEKKEKLVVDPVLYMRAHFFLFKKNTFPARLVGKHSTSIYLEYVNSKVKVVSSKKLYKKALESTLSDLSSKRKEDISYVKKFIGNF